MKWLPLASIPIAASNTVGAAIFWLKQQGVFFGDIATPRAIVFVLAVVVSVLVARGSKAGVGLGLLILALGIISSGYGIFLGLSSSSTVAASLASVWLVVFAASAYILTKRIGENGASSA